MARFRDQHARDRAWGRWLRRHCTRPIVQRVGGPDLPRPLTNAERLAAWASQYHLITGPKTRPFPAVGTDTRQRGF